MQHNQLDPNAAFYRPTEAAHYCRSSRRWLTKQVTLGLLPVIRPSKRMTLFARADLDAYLLKFRRGKVGR